MTVRRKKRAPARTLNARENQLIDLAVTLAEQQLINGTATSQVIVHYLKLGSTRERLEKERLEHENELLKAKTESLQSAAKLEETYLRALAAMKQYSGKPDNYDED